MKIFISYRRDDSSGHVGRLHDRLIESFSPDEIFVDIDAIEPGQDFIEAIEQAVTSSDVLLAVIGKQWLTLTDAQGARRLDHPHDFVRLEIATALSRNIRIIPVLVRGASMPDSSELPEDLRALTRRNAMEIGEKSFHHDASKLIAVLKRMSMAGEPAHLRVQTKSRAASVVSAPHKDSRAPALPEWSIILSSAAIMGLDLFLFAALWNTFRADSVDDVTGEFFLLLSIAWVIHGLTTEALLHGSHYITRHRENKLAWFIKTALMGMAANGLLLRRSSLPIGWGQVLIVAAGWVAAFFLGGTLVEFIMETVIRNPDWATLNSSNVSYPGIFFVGLVVGALGGLVTLLAAKWNQRRQRLRSSA